MPFKLALIVVAPVSVTCAVLYFAGVPWTINGRIAAVLVVFVFIAGLFDRSRDRVERQRARLLQQNHETVVSIAVHPREPPVGLGRALIAGLPVYKYEKMRGDGGGGDECAVCLGEMSPSEVVKQLPACTHLFHEACIDVWLSSHRTCPVCRSRVDASTVPDVELTVRVHSLDS